MTETIGAVLDRLEANGTLHFQVEGDPEARDRHACGSHSGWQGQSIVAVNRLQ